MEKCRILVVEDESLVAMDMVDMITRMGYEALPNAMDYKEAILNIEQQLPDLVLLDINLGGSRNGIDLAEILKDKYNIPFIFITAHADKRTVGQAAATLPGGYLIKPFTANDLFVSIEVALVAFAKRNGESNIKRIMVGVTESIIVKTEKTFTKIYITDILWIESRLNYLHIVCEKERFTLRSNFKDFLANLPVEEFIQVQKSFYVSKSKINSYSNKGLTISGHSIPISRKYKNAFLGRVRAAV